MKKELELYFHIPFCVRKCLYCDFLSGVADDETKHKYMGALLAETAGSAFQYGDYRVVTIFIGGGTPSIVSEDDIEELLATVKEKYVLAEDVEVTIEVNPGTVNLAKLSHYFQCGINRLSIGLQSAHNDELASIGRIHTWEQFQGTYRDARKAGFTNVNVDIMSSLPGQDLAKYQKTLEKVLALEPMPEHISAYSLILEEGTLLYDHYEKGLLELPDEETDRKMYQETGRILSQKGYDRYEISNYARKGRQCRHNCGYWRRSSYAGFGIGAASLVNNVRFKNSTDLKRYIAHPLQCREEIQVLSQREQMEEFMFLGLRMTEGVSCEEFEQLFGCTMEEVYGQVIHKNICDGLLKETGKGRIFLTDKGVDLSNYVMAQFLN